MRALIATATAALLLASTVLVTGPAGAAPRVTTPQWSTALAASVPQPTGGFADVSCAGGHWCMAVGSHTGLDGFGRATSAIWNGAWRSVPSLAAAGAVDTEVESVSCSSRTFCLAVGSAERLHSGLANHYFRGFGEVWNGHTWRRLAVPRPSGSGDTFLGDVSCVGATCTVLANYSDHDGTVERWAGGHWRTLGVPYPRGSDGGELTSIDCPTVTSCVAVGDYTKHNAGLPSALAEHWNGTRWSMRTPSNNLPDVEFTALSCASAQSCVATGSVGPNDPGRTFIERWDGTRWSPRFLPGPHGTGHLLGVSCASTSICRAIGFFSSAHRWHPYIERRVGATWTATPLAAGSEDPYSAAISCSGPQLCVEVGTGTAAGNETTLARHWNGRGWRIDAAPDPAGESGDSLSAITCRSAVSCTAVGTSENGVLAESLTTNGWRVQAAPAVPDLITQTLTGVSCPSASFCVAVGSAETANTFDDRVLLETWNGHRWQLGHVPLPSGAPDRKLEAVSCTSATFCIAVGTAGDSQATERTLIEKWNGSSWRLQSDPEPAPHGLTNELTGISCTSPTWCVAAGNGNDANQSPSAIIEHWDGTAWHLVPPSGVQSGKQLAAVSCTSPTFCIAVGSRSAAKWDGTSWTATTMPRPANDGGYAFYAVSCSAPASCTAVGNAEFDYYGESDIDERGRPFSERWGGTRWVLVRVPMPRLSGAATLNAVSCPSGAICRGVGDLLRATQAPLSARLQ